MFAWAPGARAAGSAPVGSGVPQGTRAEAFDAILQRVTGPESLDSTRSAYNADLERLRSLLPANDLSRDVRFRSVYCGNSDRWKDPAAGLAYSDRALAMARTARDVASEARARLCRAAYVMYTSGTQRGLPELDQAIALLQDAGEPQLLSEAVEMRGDLHSLLGEQAKAMVDFQRARAGYRDAGIRKEVEPLMLSVAVAYRRMGLSAGAALLQPGTGADAGQARLGRGGHQPDPARVPPRRNRRPGKGARRVHRSVGGRRQA